VFTKTISRHVIFGVCVIAICFTLGCKRNAENTYTDKIFDLPASNGRIVSVRVLTPNTCEACPLIIFSHGANAAFDRYDNLILPFARAGYQVAAPNHTDSEENPNRADYTQSDWLPTRLEDYNVISAAFDTNFRVAAGHSFGALTAQIAGGTEVATGAKINPVFSPKAVLAYSPPGPIPNYIDKKGWSKIGVPSLVTTGTTDIVPMMAEKWELHLASFEAGPANKTFALIYNNMDHYMNGAYGRETETQSTERDTAMKHMIDASIFFMSSIPKDGNIPSIDWATQKRDYVDARAK